ncbi:MAG: deoxyribonuclease V [Armatimonadota bacterium]
MWRLVRRDLMHGFDLGVSEAQELQRALSVCVETTDRLPPVIKSVCGVDVSHSRFSARVYAAAVLLSFPEMDTVAEAFALKDVFFPYIPGLLAFRELPAVLECMDKLPELPDLVIVDGHGLAHPRRFGIACHLGVLLDVPSIGCAKSVLVGAAPPPGNSFGDRTELRDGADLLGYALRTRPGAKPVYVSPGHRVSLETAASLVLRCCKGFRVPEPIRQAHMAANRARSQVWF